MRRSGWGRKVRSGDQFQWEYTEVWHNYDMNVPNNFHESVKKKKNPTDIFDLFPRGMWATWTYLVSARSGPQRFCYLRLILNLSLVQMCSKSDTAPPWILSGKPAKCEVDQRGGSLDVWTTYRHTEGDSLLFSNISVYINCSNSWWQFTPSQYMVYKFILCD